MHNLNLIYALLTYMINECAPLWVNGKLKHLLTDYEKLTRITADYGGIQLLIKNNLSSLDLYSMVQITSSFTISIDVNTEILA